MFKATSKQKKPITISESLPSTEINRKIPRNIYHCTSLQQVLNPRSQSLPKIGIELYLDFHDRKRISKLELLKVKKLPLIHGWKTIRCLEMTLFNSDKQAHIKLLLKCLDFANFSKTKYLSLQVHSYDVGDKTVERFIQRIFRNFTQLKHLTLDLSGTNSSENLVSILREDLRQASSKLQTLRLNLDSGPEMTLQTIKMFSHCRLCDINFTVDAFEDSLAPKFKFEAKVHPKKSKPFICTIVSNREFIHVQNAALEIIHTENFAQEINSSLEFTQRDRFKDDTLQRTGLDIANFRKLRQLNVSLLSQNNKKVSKGLVDFMQSISTMDQLKVLVLNIRGFRGIYDTALGRLGKTISQMTFLEELTIVLITMQSITSKGAKKFVPEICQDLKDLKHLSIDFIRCKGVTKDDLDHIKDTLSKYRSQASNGQS